MQYLSHSDRWDRCHAVHRGSQLEKSVLFGPLVRMRWLGVRCPVRRATQVLLQALREAHATPEQVKARPPGRVCFPISGQRESRGLDSKQHRVGQRAHEQMGLRLQLSS